MTNTTSELLNDSNFSEEALRNIAYERVDYLYGLFYQRFSAYIATTIIVTYIIYEVVPRKYLLAWLIAGILVFFFRLFTHIAYYRSKVTPNSNLALWRRLFLSNSIAVGSFFGSSAFTLYFTDSPIYELALAATAAAYGTGVMNTTVSYPLASIAFSTSAVLPFVVGFFLSATPMYFTLAVLLLLLMFQVVSASLRSSKSYNELLALRFMLVEQKQRAEEANIAKSIFLAAASHDLRQPLHSLSLFTGILEERINESENRDIVTNINKSVSALEDLFSALLDISRLDAQVVVPKVTCFDLSKLMQRLGNEFTPMFKEKGINFRLHCQQLAVETDPVLLETIVRNLVSNSLRYTNSGFVSVTCVKRANHVKIKISDSGVGIPKEKQTDIFKEFYQLQNPERDRRKGLGLGLAIVNRLVTLLGHELKLISIPNKGTTIIVKLPVSHQILPDADSAGLSQLEKFNKLVVVVVDDELDILKGMKQLLEDWGCHVITGTSGNEIVTALQDYAGNPHVLIVDYRLREDETGAEVIQQIEKLYKRKFPALIITGDTAENRIREMQASGYQLLHKPVPPAKLRAYLRSVAAQNKT